MADQKISQLSDGGASQAADEYVIARSGSNYRIDGASVAAAATSVGTLSSLTVSGTFTGSTIAANSNSNGVVTIGSFRNADAGTDARTRVRLGNNASESGLTIDMLSSTNTVGGSMARIINQTGTGDLVLGTNGTEGMRLDASGNLGLGVTPSAWGSGKAFEWGHAGTALWAVNSGSWTLSQNAYYTSAWKYGVTGAASYYAQSAGAHQWFTAPSGTAGNTITFTTAMTLDASGNLGLGVTPSAWNSGYKAIQVKNASLLQGSAIDDATLAANMFVDASLNEKYIGSNFASKYTQYNGKHMFFTAASGTANNNISFTQAMTLDASGNLGVGGTPVSASGTTAVTIYNGTASALYLQNSTTGTTSSDGATLQMVGNDLTITNRESGIIELKTANTERARITSGGDVCVNTTGLDGQLRVAAPNEVKWARTTSHPYNGAQYFDSFRYGTTEIGTITGNNTATAYNTSSDRRLKENIEPAEDAGDIIDAIQIVQYDWKVGGHTRFGIVAQDEVANVPEAILVGDDEDEIVRTWGVDYSKLVPMLVKEIQSLRARVASLEAGA